MTEPTAVRDALVAAGRGEPIDAQVMGGGDISTAWRVTCKNGTVVVIKTFGRVSGDDVATPPADLYEKEADGLSALRTIGGIRTPNVLAVTPTALVLEELGPAPDDDPVFWARAGRSLAIMHGVLGPRFGWQHDGWLGRLRQENAWHDDGYEFFATRRILRWLPEPAVAAALDAADRNGLERICARLPHLVPPAPACLTHGDLARSNVLADGRRPAWIDPAVSWMWPDVDLSMIYCLGMIHPPSRPPDRFFEAYADIRPLDVDWRDRMPLLHLRELLSLLAHFGNDRWDLVGQIRGVLRTFA